MTNANTNPVRGLIVPIATPITADETVAVDQLRRLTRHIVDGGADGLFVLGTTGEVGSLSDVERRRALETVLDENAGSVPVFVGVSAEGTQRVLAHINAYARYRVAAFAATLPYYYPAHGQDEVFDFYSAIMDATDRPLIIYNHPGIAGTRVEPETVARLAATNRCIGLKDATGDMRYFQSLAFDSRISAAIGLVQGNEPMLLPSLLLGGHGGLNGIANVTPRLFARLIHAFQDGDLAVARQCHAMVIELSRVVYESGDNARAVIKEGLAVLGIANARPCRPSRQVCAETRERLAQVLQQVDSALQQLDQVARD